MLVFGTVIPTWWIKKDSQRTLQLEDTMVSNHTLGFIGCSRVCCRRPPFPGPNDVSGQVGGWLGILAVLIALWLIA
jgi:hypothetical protein